MHAVPIVDACSSYWKRNILQASILDYRSTVNHQNMDWTFVSKCFFEIKENRIGFEVVDFLQ